MNKPICQYCQAEMIVRLDNLKQWYCHRCERYAKPKVDFCSDCAKNNWNDFAECLCLEYLAWERKK